MRAKTLIIVHSLASLYISTDWLFSRPIVRPRKVAHTDLHDVKEISRVLHPVRLSSQELLVSNTKLAKRDDDEISKKAARVHRNVGEKLGHPISPNLQSSRLLRHLPI